MRNILLSLVAATALVSAATLTAPRAEAMTVGSAAAIQTLIQDTDAIENVVLVCRHRPFTSGQRCRDIVVCRHRPFTSGQRCR